MKIHGPSARRNEGPDYEPTEEERRKERKVAEDIKDTKNRELNKHRDFMIKNGPPKRDLLGRDLAPEEIQAAKNDFLIKKNITEGNDHLGNDPYVSDDTINSFLKSVKEASVEHGNMNPSKEPFAHNTSENIEALTDIEKDNLAWLNERIPIHKTIVDSIRKEYTARFEAWKVEKGIPADTPIDSDLALNFTAAQDSIDLEVKLSKFSNELKLFERDRDWLLEKEEKAKRFNDLPEHKKNLIRKINKIQADMETEEGAVKQSNEITLEKSQAEAGETVDEMIKKIREGFKKKKEGKDFEVTQAEQLEEL